MGHQLRLTALVSQMYVATNALAEVTRQESQALPVHRANKECTRQAQGPQSALVVAQGAMRQLAGLVHARLA